MKAHLMHPDRDFDPRRALPPHHEDLARDLGVETLLTAMAAGDEVVSEVARTALFSGLTDTEAIGYRQGVLADCLAHPSVVRDLYGLAVEAVAGEKRVHAGLVHTSPESVLNRSVQLLELFTGILRRLRTVADEHAASFCSAGFTRFFRMLSDELSDDFFREARDHLGELQFRRGTTISMRLGEGNRGTDHVLRRTPALGWRERLAPRRRADPGFQIAERDEAGARHLAELRERGINLVADALARSTDHILAFFAAVRAELAFYVGCLTLHERLTGQGEPTCFPETTGGERPALTARGLYDPCLSLTVGGGVVGNDLNAGDRRLVVVTGANQGGKSTFLRSVGLARLMAGSGMFVAAAAFRTDVGGGVFSHFPREEDAALESGKLDEELRRMSDLADRITPGSLVLCNESFASTNEREGSEIARQVIRALVDSRVTVVCVTHLFDLAHGFYREGRDDALFLRAERLGDGRRTHALREGEPLPTSYGADSYRRVFGGDLPTGSTPA